MKKEENMRKLIKTNQILSEIKLKTEFYEIKAQKLSKITLGIPFSAYNRALAKCGLEFRIEKLEK